MKCLRLALLVPLALLCACGSDDTVQPGGISESEAQELNDAAAMLDANAVDIDALPASAENGQDTQP